MDRRLKEEALAGIKDPTVREHYRAKLEMAEELEAEGVRTGGIFDVPGVEESGFVTTPLEVTTPPRRQVPSAIPGLVVLLVVLAASLLTWWLR